MKLHFPWNEIEKLIEEVDTATTAKTLYEEETGKGLWLVGDQGVYLMPNTTDGIHHAKLGKDDRRLVVYARECNPDRMEFDDWWDNKRQSFGGDDGVEFLNLQEIRDMAAHGAVDGHAPDSLAIEFTSSQIALSVVFKTRHDQRRYVSSK